MDTRLEINLENKDIEKTISIIENRKTKTLLEEVMKYIFFICAFFVRKKREWRDEAKKRE